MPEMKSCEKCGKSTAGQFCKDCEETVIRKIQKLFQLANSDRQEEAEAAMAMAQKLLAQYNLDTSEALNARVAGGVAEQAPEKRAKTQMKRSAQYQWQRDMWEAIAKANFCWHSIIWVYDAKRGKEGGKVSQVRVKRHLVLGRESNVIAVQLMGEYLEDAIERMLPYPNAERMSRASNNWKLGCSETLIKRIWEQAEARMNESDAARAAADSATRSNAGATTALCLRDVFSAEYAANYDARRGEGSYARKLAADAAWEAGAPERERLRAEQEAEQEAAYLRMLQNESPLEKRQREREEAKETRRQERAAERMDRKWDNENYREAAKYDGDARRAGARAGKSISLATQVTDTGSGRKIAGGR